MLEELNHLLDRLDTALAIHRPKLRQMLQPGLSRAEIEAKANTLPFALTEELYSIYMWRNGTAFAEGDTLGEAGLFNGVEHFLALEDALSIASLQGFTDPKHMLVFAPDRILDVVGTRRLFPLFDDGGGSHCFVACEAQGALTGPVIGTAKAETPILMGEDLTAVIKILVDAYESGDADPLPEWE